MSPDIVSVIACGPSALQCGAMRAPGYRIAINGAREYVPHDVFLTMDGRYARERFKQFEGTNAYVRASAWEHCVRDHDASRWGGLNVFSCDINTTNLSSDPLQLNGSNSGACGIALAFALKPRRVFLYGFDMGKRTHFFGNYPWLGLGCTTTDQKFRAWRAEFEHTRRQFDAAGIEIWNTNPQSEITAFKHGRPA